MAARKKGTVFRVTGLPASQPDDELKEALEAAIDDNLAEDEQSKLTPNTAIVPSCYDNDEKVALVEFYSGVPAFLSELMADPLGDCQIDMADTDVGFDQHFFGFTQLYTPALPATADIIAITGLDGHAYGSWRGKGNLGRMWLRDFLSKDLPCCRTMIYGYNSKLSTHGIDTIMDYGRGLIEELKKARNTEELRKRPLFFIAHSFGGIILAHCLIKAVQADEDDHPTIASLYRATYGMLLFGIPHKGLVVDDIQKMVAGQGNHPRSALLEQIRSKSDLLAFQLDDFRNLIRDRKVDSESRRWRRTGDFVTAVDADSALLHLPPSIEDKIPLDADHSMMVKFENKNSRGYTSARDKLRRFEQDAPSVVAARFCTQREDFSVVFSLSGVHDIERFVAREAELSEMRRELSGDCSRRTVILHGLGGIGKTQLSVAYAKRHKDSYSAIFWLNIKDEDSLKQSFAKMARQISREHPSTLRLSNLDINESLDEVVDVVKAWLSRPNNTRWLMIFDNYDNPTSSRNSDPTAVDIQNFFPESHQGSIVITTRSSQVRIGHSIQVRKLGDVRDSLEILSNVSRREGLRSDPDAIMLATELDGLPLALATAGAYLDQVAVSLSDYLRLYKQSWLQLQESSPELDSYEDRTLYSTWQISFNHAKQQNDLSAKLLCFWAYFDSQDLWLELLQHSDLNDPDWVRELTKDEVSFHQAVRVLSSHGLVEVDTSSQGLIESRGYSIHGCVHSWTIHVLNRTWDHGFARLAIKFIGSHVLEKKTDRPWLTQRRLLQHAMRCSYMVLNSLVPDDDIAWECHNLGLLYADQGKLVEAEQMYQRALQGYEKALGLEHTSTLNTVNSLGTRRPGQAGRRRADVPAGAARLREGLGSGAHVDSQHGQQPRDPLRRPGQAGRGRADVPAGAARLREGLGSRAHIDAHYNVPAGAARLREGLGSGAHVDSQHGQQPRDPLRRPGQAGRRRADVPAGAARLREGLGSGAHVDARHSQQPRAPLRRPGQAGRGRAGVPAGAARQGEGLGSGAHVDSQHGQQPREPLRRPGQADRGRADAPAGAARLREGLGSGAHIDAQHGQQPRGPLRRPGQADRGRADAPAGAARQGEGLGSGAHVDSQHGQQPRDPLRRPGQAGRGRADVPAGAARQGEGLGSRAHVDAQHGQQPRDPLRRPGQAGRRRADVPAGAARLREGLGSGAHIDAQHGQQPRKSLQ
ncbi:hypothetical protein V493_00848 [Pseudogymnoascus sp. VKM F-4281 (FW-2241)]|nr:hypothetical protein V493_00848 [Pseudogymnoascus sp. VKM F-4281 (FW-2241)]